MSQEIEQLPNGQKYVRLQGVHVILAYNCEDCGCLTTVYVKEGDPFVEHACHKCDLPCMNANMVGFAQNLTILCGDPIAIVIDDKAKKLVEQAIPEIILP